MSNKVGDAIKVYFAQKKISNTDAAKMLDITPQAVSLQLGRTFGPNNAVKWSEVFGFRINWLRTGEGPMFDEPSVMNNTSGGDMIINSPGASTGSSDGDVRVYRDLYEKALAENVSLRAKLYKLMDRLSQNGLDCECD